MDTSNEAVAASAAETELNRPVEIDVSDLDTQDESDMTVVNNGKLTTWVWTFAGPGHPKAVAQSNRLSRARLHEEKEIQQKRNNGKKWTPTEETPDEIRAHNVAYVVERLLRWSPVKLNGEALVFSPEAATRLLLDPRKGTLLLQALEYLNEDKSFIKRSATS